MAALNGVLPGFSKQGTFCTYNNMLNLKYIVLRKKVITEWDL